MVYGGMDVHARSTVFCLYEPTAEARRQYRTVTCATTTDAIQAVLRPLEGHCRAAFEVGAQAQWIARIVRPAATEVQVANPRQIPWRFRDRRKNDRLDARKLATRLYLNPLPTVHLPSADVSVWRALINDRRTLVKRRTMTKNPIRSILRTFGAQCPHRSGWSRKGLAWLRSPSFDAARAWMVKSRLDPLDALDRQVHESQGQLDAIATTHPNVALLQTIPGIGPRTAEAIVAFTDDVGRFGNRKPYGCCFGMTPTQDASGRVDRHDHISQRGPSVVRWVLIQAVHRIIGRCPAFRAFFARIHRGRKDRYKKAIVATGRKVLSIRHAMQREPTSFDPGQAARQVA